MLTHLLGVRPGPALAAAVASRADGIPFAVEELALALRDGGATVAVVPDGIREAVLLRTARLSGEERTLLETAAVAGQEFDMDPVLAVCGLAAWPDGFTGAGLLTEVRDGRAAFRHSLTHEAAYADIPWSRRRACTGSWPARWPPRRGAGPDRQCISSRRGTSRPPARPSSRRRTRTVRCTRTATPPGRCGRCWSTGPRTPTTTPGWPLSAGWPGARRCARSTPRR